VYRWDKVAELAVNTRHGERIRMAPGPSVAFHPVIKHQDGSQTRVACCVKRSQIGFATATDARTAAFKWGRVNVMICALTNPAQSRSGSRFFLSAATRAGDTRWNSIAE